MSWNPEDVLRDFTTRQQSVAALSNTYGVSKFTVEEMIRSALADPRTLKFSAPPSRPETESAAPVSEAHVQHATVSEALMDAMCMGRWRIGPIIFGTNGHGEFRSWAILAPWPWLRDGEDTPHAAIARFQAKNPPTPTQLNHARAARLADEICASPPAETGEGQVKAHELPDCADCGHAAASHAYLHGAFGARHATCLILVGPRGGCPCAGYVAPAPAPSSEEKCRAQEWCIECGLVEVTEGGTKCADCKSGGTGKRGTTT